MAIKWTGEQKNVIEHRGKNMLVSAAAGSGKTAVLVERIISLVTDEKNPIDLDKLLVVTFTKAAAGEMKERIRKALEKKIAENPENEQLRRQAVLIHNAHISTIHSFCTYIIKNYFYYLNIDPVFRVMDEGESKLMKADCIHELVEEALQQENREIRDFILAFGSGKSTRGMEEEILSIYNMVISDPWPKKWLEKAKSNYQTNAKEIESSELIRNCIEDIKEKLHGLIMQAEINKERAEAYNGPNRYVPALQADIDMMKKMLEEESFEELQKEFKNIKHKTLPGRPVSENEDPDITKTVADSRKKLKEELKKIQENYFGISLEELQEEMSFCSGHINTLCSILLDFMERFAQKKRQNNLMDYNDLEHFALNILVKENEKGEFIKTEAAREIAEEFAYIMVDEYQDSNGIQEWILSSIAGKGGKENNRFMVGDIKQSIYGFRHACPQLFTEKYQSYRNAKDGEVIDLFSNYRSRKTVIDTVNLLFGKLMDQEMGGVDYDSKQRLNSAAVYPERENEEDCNTEIFLLDRMDPDMENGRNKKEAIETEAALVAGRIKELHKNMQIFDKEEQTYRPMRYSDCVVLLRSGSDYFEIFDRVLKNMGVPAYAMTRTGYFSAVEVRVILDYLRILDNPLQDIPMAAVLFSPIVGCTAQELAEIRLFRPEEMLFHACREYCQFGENPELTEKLQKFFRNYLKFNEMARYTPVSSLLDEIYRVSNYRSYVRVMPGGAQRAANLDMLMEKAAAYEKSSYSGLFNFIRYIDELQKASEDFGEANLFSESADAVRIMTIHKSKGLEFPIVFLCGFEKEFNKSDSKGSIIVHRDLGIGIDAIDLKEGKKKAGFYKYNIAQRIKKDMLSEELRVLYVALTRAKEKLIITMVSKDLQKEIEKCSSERALWKKEVPYAVKTSASSYAGWILPVLSNFSCFDPAEQWAGCGALAKEKCDFINIYVCSVDSLINNEKEGRLDLLENLKKIPDENESQIYDRELYEYLQKVREFEYPYRKEENIPEKLSVSDIKTEHVEEMEEEELFKEELVPYIPSFIQKEEAEKSGAERGTVYHKFWKLLRYENLTEPEHYYSELMEMKKKFCEEGKLTKEEDKCLFVKDFISFLKDPIGIRMKKAAFEGKLFREQPFTMEMQAREADSKWDSGETILIQGMIDVYFEEDGEIVLLDYKTDWTKDESGEELIQKYKKQLWLYKKALEKSSQKKVKEVMIYSTHLKKCVTL